ncbi:MAG: hypothetical protein GY799_07435 [Desulfobulbaceae bacterium]|nr:hypothetical protein [Desulfobulbaceae bacterium]
MDDISSEALTELSNALESMIPAFTPPALQTELLLDSIQIKPTGVGGFVTVNDNPRGTIYGRRVEARAAVTIKASDEDELRDYVKEITRSFLTQDRATLMGQGLFSITLDQLSPVITTGRGNNIISERNVNFNVLYEYLKLPEAAETVIDTVPLDLDINQGTGTAKFIITADLDASFLDLFDVVDDPSATQSTPSDWQYNPIESRVEQISDIRGGALTATPNKAGTQLLLKESGQVPLVENFIIHAEMESGDVDGIGFVFRAQDENNFYYFLMSSRHNYRLLGKKIDGTFSFLDIPGLDDSQGYSQNTRYQVKLTAYDSTFQIYIDNQLALRGEDNSLTDPGRVGFLCHANNQAYFYRIRLTQFIE